MSREIHYYATYIHGILTALHSVGFLYNITKKNWFDSTVHGIGMVYSLNAGLKHWDRYEHY